MSILDVNEANFEESIKSGLVLADFNAAWCGPCQMLKPIIEDLSEEIPEKIISIDIDESPELAERLGVSGIPCLILFGDGKELTRTIGVLPEKKIKKLVEKYRK